MFTHQLIQREPYTSRKQTLLCETDHSQDQYNLFLNKMDQALSQQL